MVQFHDFAYDELVGGVGDNDRNVPVVFVDDATHGLREHVVAHEDGHLGAPFLVGRNLPTSEFRTVDDVVVDEAC